jgi:chaperonin GroES
LLKISNLNAKIIKIIMASIKFKPIGDQILVKQDEPETKTKSGLILTKDSADAPKTGKVVKLGTADGQMMIDGKPFKFTVSVGSKVYWSYGGRELEIDGEKYLVMRESELLGFEE